MFRNNYDNDSVTFSPQGRIFQVEYASEAVKQGSVVVGIVSKTHAVLVALKRNAEELSSYQKKVIAIDEHLGLALAGLASDARVLSNFMKNQSLSSRLTYDRAIPIERVVASIGDRAQTNTQHYGRRPYGVGLLVAGVDETGPHLFEFQPSGMTQEMVACAIGARSQIARTYLERHLDEFAECGREELVKHGLRALKESLSQDKELTVENTCVGVVGVKAEGKKSIEAFKLFDGQEVKQWIDLVADGVEGAETGDTTDSMEVDA
ncbi:Proteasome subunit alpha type-6 [Ciborinia camelliae]|nr:Proteasome subunit alpha type-6 [Ciborinia camelliae]